MLLVIVLRVANETSTSYHCVVCNDRPDLTVRNVPAPEASLGAAFYPDKEAWNNERGNRYTPEELHAVDRNWNVQVTNPDAPCCCSAD